ncbi:MAG: hypothetical protein R2698_00665 [Microthrixaceae bacterium]
MVELAQQPPPEAVLALFDSLAGAVTRSLAARSPAELAAPGLREGQYALDLDADAVVVGPLLDADSRSCPKRPEGWSRAGGNGITVVVDPVDGSTNAARVWPTGR